MKKPGVVQMKKPVTLDVESNLIKELLKRSGITAADLRGNYRFSRPETDFKTDTVVKYSMDRVMELSAILRVPAMRLIGKKNASVLRAEYLRAQEPGDENYHWEPRVSIAQPMSPAEIVESYNAFHIWGGVTDDTRTMLEQEYIAENSAFWSFLEEETIWCPCVPRAQYADHLPLLENLVEFLKTKSRSTEPSGFMSLEQLGGRVKETDESVKEYEELKETMSQWDFNICYIKVPRFHKISYRKIDGDDSEADLNSPWYRLKWTPTSTINCFVIAPKEAKYVVVETEPVRQHGYTCNIEDPEAKPFFTNSEFHELQRLMSEEGDS